MADLNDRMERLAGRGDPRGAAAVLGAARRASALPSRRASSPLMTAAAIAAALAVVLSGGALVSGNGDSSEKTSALGSRATTTTTPAPEAPATTLAPTPTTVSKPAAPRPPERLIAASRLRSFVSCGAFLSLTKNKAAEVIGPYGLPGQSGPFMALDQAAGARRETAAAPTAGGDAASSAPAHSETNVQEKGIDEPDQVKTDGRRIFTLAQGKLFALRADGPQLQGSFPAEGAQEMLLVGDKVVLFGYAASPQPEPVASGSSPASDRMIAPYYQQRMKITVVDVANPGAMKVSGQLIVDGSYLSARLVNGVPRVVLRSQPRGMTFSGPRDDTPTAKAESTEKNRQAVRASTLGNWVPTYWAYDASGREKAAGQLGTCDASYRPPEFSGFGMLTVLNFDLARPERSAAATVQGDGEIVYASARRLYVATNQWGSVTDQNVKPSQRSLVHQFDITDPSGPRYLLSGEVRGTVLNQFSLSEQGPYLRVATTTDDGSGTGESFVTVLGDGGGALTTLGRVGGLGRGERIYAVRFIGDVGYVVTFRQVDPLYTIDLRDPKRPRVVGELKITGYSAYLHPVGPGLLLGVGQEATPEGRRAGAQVSLFDVSNPAAPRRLQQHLLGQGSSAAEFDHHAFLYWEPTGLAVLPIQQYDAGFSGAVGMKIARAGITEIGRVKHPADPRYGGSPFISRSVVIGSRLYTLSESGMLASDLNTLADRAFVRFA